MNSSGQVLLLFGQDPARPDAPYWFTIGGGVETGESPEQAAVRELFEETGLIVGVDQLTSPFHRGTHAFTFDQVRYVSDSIFFAMSLDDITVTFDGLGAGEVGNIFAVGWWAPEDLTAAVPTSHPHLRDIAHRAVTAIVAGS